MDTNIKEKIGQRIKQERLAKGLARKELADLTGSLKISSINNYERGDRTPGPNEIKQLAQALELSPAFLMCLSDDRGGKAKKTGLGGLVPILDYKQACDPAFFIEEISNGGYSEKVDFIPISNELSERIGKNAFALVVRDESMVPELRVGDVVVVDPDAQLKPGDFVIAKIDIDGGVIVRKYKQLSVSKVLPELELISLNSDWANLQIKLNDGSQLIGRVINLCRAF